MTAAAVAVADAVPGPRRSAVVRSVAKTGTEVNCATTTGMAGNPMTETPATVRGSSAAALERKTRMSRSKVVGTAVDSASRRSFSTLSSDCLLNSA